MTDTSASGDQTVPNPDLEGYDPNTGRQDKLPEDNDSPTTPANEVVRALPPDHPATDSNIDPHEAYDAGITTASGVRAHDEVEDDKNQALYGGQ